MLTIKPSGRSIQRSAVVVRAQPLNAVRKVIKDVQSAPLVQPVVTTAVANLIMAMPAHAEAGKLFDFNLTLPIMAGQFLLLMVFLDKTWFTPVGQVLDERDELIRSKLSSVQGDTGKIAEMQEQAEKALKAARNAANAAVAEAKATTQAEQDAKLDILRTQVDNELASAMTELDRERENAGKSINDQVDALSTEILGRVLPEEPEPAAAPAAASA